MPGDYPSQDCTGDVPSVKITQLRATRKARADHLRAYEQLLAQEDRELLAIYARQPARWIAAHLGDDSAGDAGRITRHRGRRYGLSRQHIERRVAEARERLDKTDPEFVARVDSMVAERVKRAKRRGGEVAAAARMGLSRTDPEFVASVEDVAARREARAERRLGAKPARQQQRDAARAEFEEQVAGGSLRVRRAEELSAEERARYGL